MKRMGLKVAVVTAVTLVGGCSTMSDTRLEARTAAVLGVQPGDVFISNRQGSEGSTTYLALVNGRRYACSFGGGGILSYGFSTPPNCNLAINQD